MNLSKLAQNMLFCTYYYELTQIKSKCIIKMFMYEKDDKYTVYT